MKMFQYWIVLFIFTFCSALPTEENVEQKSDPNYRLDTIVLPSQYNIALKPYLQKDEITGKQQFTFDGNVTINLEASQDVSEIVLHSKNIKLSDISSDIHLEDLNNATVRIEVTNKTLDTKTDKLTLKLQSPMQKDKKYSLVINNFVGQMDEDMHGFYKSNYTKKNGETIWIGSTQFQPVHARRAFPCFDEPQFKATFDISINHNSKYHAVSNTEILLTNNALEKGRTITTFKRTPRMSTYLVAFLISDFESIGDEKELAVIARGDSKDQAEYALEVGKKLLNELNEFTKLPYKNLGNPKMHLAAIPDFSAGAMENWGLLTFRERALLYDKHSTTASSQESIAAVIAHEQAHMWFGDYVTCAWWNVTWLNEGFARYFQYFITHKVNPEWELDKQFVVKQIQSVFVMDSLNNTHPMTNKETNSPSEVQRMFDSISYNKGASIIRMIEHMLGSDKFKEALRTYFKDQKIALSTSLPEDLFRAFKTQWNNNILDLDKIKQDWTEQVGYPVVTITLNNDRKSFSVTQKRFVLRKDVQDQNLKYTIPFTYVTNKNIDFNTTTPQVYLQKDQEITTVQLNEEVDWVIGNKLQTGYYRVNYDDKTWEQIHHALEKENFSKIHEINRAQIVDDLLNFGRSGLLGYDRVLHLLEYLKKENNYLPWYSALSGFSYIATRIDDKGYDLFKRHIISLIENIYNKLGFNEKQNDTRFDIHNRAQILEWACKYGNEDCIKNSKELFDKLKNNTQQVPVNLRSVVYCTALREGNSSDFEHLWNKYKNETVATEQVLILGVLGCSKSKEVTEKFLGYILTPDVRRQDKSSALSSAYSSNRENVQVVFDYVSKNVERFSIALGSYSDVASLLSNIASRFTSVDQKNQLQKFFNENKEKFGDSAKTLENAIKNVDENLRWSKENLEKLTNYLNQTYGSAVRMSLSVGVATIIAILSAVCLG